MVPTLPLGDSAQLTESAQKFWFVVPAAGVGRRMEAELPKQYLTLNNKTILEHTLELLLQLSNVAGIYVVLDARDTYWSTLAVSTDSRITTLIGGTERVDSVLKGVYALPAAINDWVLVHDAARPCVAIESIELLIASLKEHPVGGILAIPVSDTLKVVGDSQILSTQDRSCLWQAQTPQMFRYGLLRDCIISASFSGAAITDEASALEACGYKPAVVLGRSDNIKITRPDDLLMAELILRQKIHLTLEEEL
jgi:2-C-methyl-D-erythritol 4-phosphate cytidylyltransferase